MHILPILLILLLSYPAFADSFGLAMHGTAQYSAEDAHLSYANPNAPKGGHFKHSAIGTFDTLNPYTIKGKAARGLNLTTDRLMARVWDEPFTMYPLIAQSYSMPEDRSAIAFTLNPKARFHDGSPITVDDVEYSFETLREFGRPNMRRIYQLVTEVTKTDTSITFSFGEGYDQETALIVAMMPVISKTYWQNLNFESTTLIPPLSNGPYRIEKVDPGRSITYARVADYWAKDLLTNTGHHNPDRITYTYFRDDGVALEGFKAGTTNIRFEPNIARWHTAYPDMKGIVKHSIAHQRPEKARGLIFNTRRPPFDDIRVRAALNMLLDRDWIAKNIYYGEFKPINSYFPNSPLAAQIIESPPPSRRAAIRAAYNKLDEAGWIIDNGKRVKDGQPFGFEILLGAPEDEKIALNFKQSLAKAGITANIRVLDTAAYRGRLNEYDFDMTLYHWQNSLSPGTEQQLYWTCEAASQPARWNFPGICDPEVDALAASIAQATSREDLVHTAQALDLKLTQGVYMIPLFYSGTDRYASAPQIKRPQDTPLYGAVQETWWIEK